MVAFQLLPTDDEMQEVLKRQSSIIAIYFLPVETIRAFFVRGYLII